DAACVRAKRPASHHTVCSQRREKLFACFWVKNANKKLSTSSKQTAAGLIKREGKKWSFELHRFGHARTRACVPNEELGHPIFCGRGCRGGCSQPTSVRAE